MMVDSGCNAVLNIDDACQCATLTSLYGWHLKVLPYRLKS